MRDRFQWARLLAFVTGLVNQELLLRNEYLAAENRVLRAHLPSRLRLSDPERSTLAEIAKRLGRRVLRDITCVAKPDTGTLSPRKKPSGQRQSHTLPCFCSGYAGSAGRDPLSRAPRWVTQALQPCRMIILALRVHRSDRSVISSERSFGAP